MAKIFTALTYLACLLGLVSLARAISIMVGSQDATWSGTDGLQLVMRIALVWLIWMVILLLPLLIAAWIAHLSRASPLLALAPMLLMAWVLFSINGLELMPWHTVRPARRHGMGFDFELSLLGFFNLWPPTLVCLALWTAVKRWLRRRAALAVESA